MAGDTARTSSEAADTRWGVADKDFAERLIKLEHDVAVLTEVLADLVPVIKHLVNKIGDGQSKTDPGEDPGNAALPALAELRGAR